MKLTAVATGVVLGLGTQACGDTVATHIVAGAKPAKSSMPYGMFGSITTSTIPPGQPVRGDGDADNPSDIDGNGDIDVDGDRDNPTPQSYRFPDADDGATFDYGGPASGADARAIAAVVRRYYADAAARDGAAGCGLLDSSLERSVPEDYGQAGPAYLRGGKTCQAVLAMLFAHVHSQLVEAIALVGTRVRGDRGQAIFGSRMMPASYMELQRQGGVWRIGRLLGGPLP